MCVVTIARQPMLSSSSRIARPSAAPSAGSVPAPSSSSRTSDCSVALREDLRDPADVRREGRERLLEALLVADVGEHVVEDRQLRPLVRPGCAARTGPSSPAGPTVLRATVLPPVFGPVTTRIWNWKPRWTSIGTTVRGSVAAGIAAGGWGARPARARTGAPARSARGPGELARGRSPGPCGRGLRAAGAAPSEDETPFVLRSGRRHPVVEAVAARAKIRSSSARISSGPEQRVGHLADLGAEPAEDAADLLGLAGAEERELGGLLGDRLVGSM